VDGGSAIEIDGEILYICPLLTKAKITSRINNNSPAASSNSDQYLLLDSTDILEYQRDKRASSSDGHDNSNESRENISELN
jgi:hypothetical protein